MNSGDRYINGHVERLISELRPGDRVDLENDIFADPDAYFGDGLSRFEFEFEVVDHVEIESPDCSCVYFESGFVCGFPPDHWIDVDGEQVRGRA
ncbi:MAG: hypothetical protein AB7I52_17460 [Rhizobiaceae bacterium]